MTEALLPAIQRMLARASIGASTVRSQGAPGVAVAVRGFLAELQLKPFSTANIAVFSRTLDQQTQRLEEVLPRAARSWGLARKCLNIFLREAFYNAFLQARYGLAVTERLYEIPLDGVVAKALRSRVPGVLPPWPGVRHLDQRSSFMYQSVAQQLAEKQGIARVHLDAFLWGGNRE